MTAKQLVGKQRFLEDSREPDWKGSRAASWTTVNSKTLVLEKVSDYSLKLFAKT